MLHEFFRVSVIKRSWGKLGNPCDSVAKFLQFLATFFLNQRTAEMHRSGQKHVCSEEKLGSLEVCAGAYICLPIYLNIFHITHKSMNIYTHSSMFSHVLCISLDIQMYIYICYTYIDTQESKQTNGCPILKIHLNRWWVLPKANRGTTYIGDGHPQYHIYIYTPTIGLMTVPKTHRYIALEHRPNLPPKGNKRIPTSNHQFSELLLLVFREGIF